MRKDIISKSEFSRRYKIDRKTLDKLIVERMLNIEIVGTLAFINISDPAVIDNALAYRSRNPRDWQASTPIRRKKSSLDTFDSRMDEAFEAFERGESY